jgi:hypothetical protein
MFATLLIDHRLALLALIVLLIAAAAPLAYAWARLLPEEPPPFEVPAASPSAEDLVSNRRNAAKKDLLAVFLLVCVTLSYILRLPGLPLAAALQWLSALLPADYFNWTVLGGRWFFVVVPGLAAAYSALRPNPLRISLIAGGLLVLALWLVSPMLRAAIATA